ncbi:MAG: carbohydrate kinase [Flavobacteriales bacterium]|nr:carbohydrate kinase [Flavobacteriia bacterium]NCP53120.1 carbohydrate kinase [Flavobacteriales bacterium]PIV94722.1 MAG: carbohydrate kinase [Flavobacteriaceae bacterium CG17_big_fil_post_rev_8_21_14_2_50_33_15]PJB16680.1 MAG: carbohydrate kinase [Flavobacteriaceae bacterium CG_4_9_14_3_um_filter_33_16]NCQ13331.1 carbohydrate kinase [Flavobacteriales bacterium]
MARITCFGEVLWDVFPTHEKIGGAPLNVALRLNSFNHEVYMISAIGKDKRGETLINYITESGLSKAYVQMNETLETGAVQVSLNDKGSASYTIEFPRAWDAIQFNDDLKALVLSSDAFVFGSLVARDDTSKKTLFELIEASQYAIFDLNLRPPHYTKELLIHLMNKADFIKFNDEELYEVSAYLGSKYLSMEQNIRFISEVTNTKHICVTKGNHGAVLWYQDTFYYNSGYLVKVKDTVGAGDSFLASLISQLLNKVNPQDAINFACAVGAMVAKSEGANPKITLKEIESFMNPES